VRPLLVIKRIPLITVQYDKPWYFFPHLFKNCRYTKDGKEITDEIANAIFYSSTRKVTELEERFLEFKNSLLKNYKGYVESLEVKIEVALDKVEFDKIVSQFEKLGLKKMWYTPYIYQIKDADELLMYNREINQLGKIAKASIIKELKERKEKNKVYL
jgi:hypothetical protein